VFVLRIELVAQEALDLAIVHRSHLSHAVDHAGCGAHVRPIPPVDHGDGVRHFSASVATPAVKQMLSSGMYNEELLCVMRYGLSKMHRT